MNYALIGCGCIAVNHIKAALNNKLNIVAVCDPLPEKAEALLVEYDLQNDASIARYTDYRQMLAEHPRVGTSFHCDGERRSCGDRARLHRRRRQCHH